MSGLNISLLLVALALLLRMFYLFGVRQGWSDYHTRFNGKMLHELTDQDLSSVNRTWANLWQAKYFEAIKEVRIANAAAARLSAKCKRLSAKLKAIKRPTIKDSI